MDIARGIASIDELIEAATEQAKQQWLKGKTIGERQTPVRSIWPMRDKWKKYGKWWTVLGRDGDVKFTPGVGPIVPMVMQLFYFLRNDGQVEQLAWERSDLYERWKQYGQEPSISIFGESFIAKH